MLNDLSSYQNDEMRSDVHVPEANNYLFMRKSNWATPSYLIVLLNEVEICIGKVISFHREADRVSLACSERQAPRARRTNLLTPGIWFWMAFRSSFIQHLYKYCKKESIQISKRHLYSRGVIRDQYGMIYKNKVWQSHGGYSIGQRLTWSYAAL